MQMVFLYGPPGVGKLTVSNEIARLTGFRVFHNHLTIDAVLPVFEFGTPPFGRLIRVMREAVLAEAAREGIDLVFTSVYVHPQDIGYMEQMCAAVENNGGEVALVQLLCDLETLAERVEAESRLSASKLSSADALRAQLDSLDMSTALPGRESLTIDNSRLSARDVAERIITHFGLERLDAGTALEA
jgi:hypothetical protein